MAKRTLVFNDDNASLATLADVMINQGALEQIDAAGFAVASAPLPENLMAEIVIAQAIVGDALNAQQNAAAGLLRLARRMVEEEDARQFPTFVESLTVAIGALRQVADEMPPEGYALPAQLAIDLARFTHYLEDNGYGERRPARVDSAGGAGAAGDSAGAAPVAGGGPVGTDGDAGGAAGGTDGPAVNGPVFLG